jgi:tetratricopeptide (TPR) repeat protein
MKNNFVFKITTLTFFPLLIFLFSCRTEKNTPDFYSKSFINKKPNIPKAYTLEQEAVFLSRKNENKKAVEILTKLINKYPDYNHLYRVYTVRGISFHKLHKFQKALMDYKKAIRIYPYYINAWVSMGLLYKNMGKTKLAKHVFLRCMKIMPEKKKEFSLFIAELKPFVKAYLVKNTFIFRYDFLNMSFIIKNPKGMSIRQTKNPFQPFIITLKPCPEKTRIYMFVMDFSKTKKFRFLEFKKRVKRWVNFEIMHFITSKKIKIEYQKIKEVYYKNKHCAYIDFNEEKFKYRMVFYFASK